MKLTIDINTANNQAQKLLAFLETLDFVKIEKNQIEIPEFHKKIVRERLRTSKPSDYTSWEDVQKEFDALLGQFR